MASHGNHTGEITTFRSLALAGARVCARCVILSLPRHVYMRIPDPSSAQAVMFRRRQREVAEAEAWQSARKEKSA